MPSTEIGIKPPSFAEQPIPSEMKQTSQYQSANIDNFESSKSAGVPSAVQPVSSVDITEKNIELQQLRAEVSRLKATNEMIQRERNELERNRPDLTPLRRTNTTDLTQTADDLAR